MNPIEKSLGELAMPVLPAGWKDRLLIEAGRRQGAHSSRGWRALCLVLGAGLGASWLPYPGQAEIGESLVAESGSPASTRDWLFYRPALPGALVAGSGSPASQPVALVPTESPQPDGPNLAGMLLDWIQPTADKRKIPGLSEESTEQSEPLVPPSWASRSQSDTRLHSINTWIDLTKENER